MPEVCNYHVIGDYWVGGSVMRVAVPVQKQRFAANFKEFEQVILLDTENHKIQRKRLVRPNIRSCMLPLWFRQHNVDLLIVGNMNEIAVGLFQKAGIKVVTGAPHLFSEEMIEKYLSDF